MTEWSESKGGRRRLWNCHSCGRAVTREEYLTHLRDGCSTVEVR